MLITENLTQRVSFNWEHKIAQGRGGDLFYEMLKIYNSCVDDFWERCNNMFCPRLSDNLCVFYELTRQPVFCNGQNSVIVPKKLL